MTLIEQLRHRVEETRSALESAQAAVAEAQEARDALVADLAGYEKALQAETRRENAAGASGDMQATAAMGETAANVTRAVLDGNDNVSKTDLVYNLIREHVDGMSPPEVYRAVLARGIEMHRNYVYSILGRLEKQRKIVQRQGRYVAAISAVTELFNRAG